MRRLFRLFKQDDATTRAELDEEIRFHIECRTDQLVRQGRSADDARIEAARRFTRLGGNVTTLATAARRRERRMRLRDGLDSIRQDVTFAMRSMRRQRTFSSAVLLTLAIAIGGCTAVFGVTYAVMLRRLPYPSPDRIVSLVAAPAGFTKNGVALERAINESPLLDAAALYVTGGNAVVGEVTPVRARVTQTSPRFFSVFAVAPQVGRVFAADEGVPGRNAVIVMSYEFWKRTFDARPDVVGRSIVANGQRFTLVGVMPPGFDFPGGTDLWVPLPDKFSFFNYGTAGRRSAVSRRASRAHACARR